MHGLEMAVIKLANVMQVLFEAASILVVAAGGIAFGYTVLSQRFVGQVTKSRQTLARHVAVALELQQAADIIATAPNPSTKEFAKLAVIALIRTFLNCFVVLEMRGNGFKEHVSRSGLKG